MGISVVGFFQWNWREEYLFFSFTFFLLFTIRVGSLICFFTFSSEILGSVIKLEIMERKSAGLTEGHMLSSFSYRSVSTEKTPTDFYCEPKLTALAFLYQANVCRSPEDGSVVSCFDEDVFFVFLKAQWTNIITQKFLWGFSVSPSPSESIFYTLILCF